MGIGTQMIRHLVLLTMCCFLMVAGCKKKSTSETGAARGSTKASIPNKMFFKSVEPTEAMTMEEFKQAWEVLENQVEGFDPESLGMKPDQKGFVQQYIAMAREAQTKLRLFMTMARSRINQAGMTSSDVRTGRRIAQDAEELIDEINSNSAELAMEFAEYAVTGDNELTLEVNDALLLVQEFKTQLVAEEGEEDYKRMVKMLSDPEVIAAFRAERKADNLHSELYKMIRSGTHPLAQIEDVFEAMIEARRATAAKIELERGEEGRKYFEEEIVRYEHDFEVLKPMIEKYSPYFVFLKGHKLFNQDSDIQTLTDQDWEETIQWLAQSDAVFWASNPKNQEGELLFQSNLGYLLVNAASYHLNQFGLYREQAKRVFSKEQLEGMPFALIQGLIVDRVGQLGQEDEQGKVWQSYNKKTTFTNYIYQGMVRNDNNETCDLVVTEGVTLGQDKRSYNCQLGPVRP